MTATSETQLPEAPHQSGTCVLATATALVIGSVIGTGVFAAPAALTTDATALHGNAGTTITASQHSER
jgi:hypothetical protein